jgi:integrase
MRGSLREKRPDYWEVRVEIGVDAVTGKRSQISKVVRGTRREAERSLNELIAKASAGSAGGTTAATFSDLLDAWMEHAATDLAYQTIVGYNRLINKRIKPALGTVKLRKLDSAKLDQFYRSLTAVGLSPATIRQAHAIIRRALGQAVKWEWLAVNAALKASPPRLVKSVTTPPTPAAVIALMERAKNSKYPEFSVIIHAAAVTGARRGELCGLKWSDFDFEAPAVLISRSVYETKEHVMVEKDTKTHQARRISLDKATVAVLHAHREMLAKRAYDCGTELVKDAYVFSDSDDCSQPWIPSRVTLAYRRLCDEFELTGMRFHDLRHFAATRLLAAGIDVRTVSGRLGHANAATTLGTYSHFIGAADVHAADVLGEIVSPKRVTPAR